MTISQRIRFRLALCAVFALPLGCKGDPLSGLTTGTGPSVSDAQLFALTPSSTEWKYYRNSSVTFPHASSPHPEPLIRVRFNARAATQLDASAKVRLDANFPDSSVIVKELYNGAVLSRYAVMMKLRESASAGFGGWIWAEYRSDGGTSYSTSGRGGACSSCHSAGIDYTRMNDSHP